MRRRLPSSLFLAVLSSAAAAQPASPPDTTTARQQLQDTERARAGSLAAQREATSRAAAAAAAEQALAAARIAAATKLREAEDATLAVVRRMDALARKRQEADARLQAQAASLAPLLPVVERLSLYPAETLLAAPGSTEDAVRGLILLRGLSLRTEAEAAALRRAQAEADTAARDLRAQMPLFTAAEAAQEAQARELDRQLAAAEAGRRAAVDEAVAAARETAAAAARAQNLRAAISTLEGEAARAERQRRSDAAARRQQTAAAAPAETASLPPGAAPRGQLTVPVAGTIVRGWGAPGDAGPATGVTYQAPPAARVVAMCGGRVEFAAPFRSYGLLLIVDCGGGYHAVMAGFDRLDAKVGQLVRAGEPVGAMPSWSPGQTGARPTLYVELRRGDQPVDPRPWLKAGG